MSRAVFAEGVESTDVGLCVSGQDEADRRHVAGRQVPSAEDDVDERAARPAVAVRERVDVADVPAPFKGSSIALITAGLISMAFLGFSGLVKG